MNEERLKNQLRKHWHWLKEEENYEEVLKILVAFSHPYHEYSVLKPIKEEDIIVIN